MLDPSAPPPSTSLYTHAQYHLPCPFHLVRSTCTCPRASHDPIPHIPLDDECCETSGHPPALSWHAVDDGPAGRYK
jgi:hypothetical protein